MECNCTLVPCSTQSPAAGDPSSASVPLLFDPKTQKQAQERVLKINALYVLGMFNLILP